MFLLPLKLISSSRPGIVTGWVKMANKHMKRCSRPLSIRETQVKTAMRNHLTPTRMAIIKSKTKQNKKTENSRYWQE